MFRSLISSRTRRAWIGVFLSVCLLLAMLPPRAAALDASSPIVPLPYLDGIGTLSAKAAVLMDESSGQLLYAKNESLPLPMASTTKIMTALCAVELADVNGVIEVDPAAVGIEGSSVYLYANESLTLTQLLYALLLESANDAAVAIAIGISGSVEAFAAQMNEKARELGLENTHFENPHGLDGETHYTTAHDLALIAREALRHPLLRTIFATGKITIPLNGSEGVRSLQNHNKMLRNYDGAIGVKTGFTKKSGRCLVSAAERDGLTLIAVTLCAPDDWNDHERMLDAGFAALERVTLCARGGFETLLPITGGREGYVIVQNATAQAVTLPRNRGSMLCTVELPRFLYAAVYEGESVGQLVFRCDVDGDGVPEDIARIPLKTTYAVEQRGRIGLLRRLWDRLTGRSDRISYL